MVRTLFQFRDQRERNIDQSADETLVKLAITQPISVEAMSIAKGAGLNGNNDFDTLHIAAIAATTRDQSTTHSLQMGF